MSKVAKAAIGLMAATLVAKILGFGREITLASAYGASSISDEIGRASCRERV